MSVNNYVTIKFKPLRFLLQSFLKLSREHWFEQQTKIHLIFGLNLVRFVNDHDQTIIYHFNTGLVNIQGQDSPSSTIIVFLLVELFIGKLPIENCCILGN